MRLSALLLAAALLAAGEAPAPSATAAPSGPRGFLGIEVDAAATAFDDQGLLVAALTTGGTAEKLGLAAGDRLRQLNGQPVKSQDQLRAVMNGLRAGDAITVVVARTQPGKPQPQEMTLKGVLLERPRPPAMGAVARDLADLQTRVRDLDRKAKEPTLAEILQTLKEIEQALPRAAEDFKRTYPNGEFSIRIQIDVVSDRTAKDPVLLEVGGAPAAPATAAAAATAAATATGASGR